VTVSKPGHWVSCRWQGDDVISLVNRAETTTGSPDLDLALLRSCVGMMQKPAHLETFRLAHLRARGRRARWGAKTRRAGVMSGVGAHGGLTPIRSNPNRGRLRNY
jgi:hypothetical protein